MLDLNVGQSLTLSIEKIELEDGDNFYWQEDLLYCGSAQGATEFEYRELENLRVRNTLRIRYPTPTEFPARLEFKYHTLVIAAIGVSSIDIRLEETPDSTE